MVLMTGYCRYNLYLNIDKIITETKIKYGIEFLFNTKLVKMWKWYKNRNLNIQCKQ